MKPYKYLKGNILSIMQLSPERGQLFLSLMNSNLKSQTFNQIYWKGNFKYAEMDGLQFQDFDLVNFTFENASFKYTNFEGCKLAKTEF